MTVAVSAVTCPSPLRWAGGKRKLVPLLAAAHPEPIGRLVEPFLGGGSVMLGLRTEEGVGSDTNGDLINFYQQCKADAQGVVAVLDTLADDRDSYYEVRSWTTSDRVEQAARFAYLNRTAYFGLYRTNRSGGFNVPYGGGGRLNHTSFAERLLALSRVLQRVSLSNDDYLRVLAGVEPGDVVFLDPPYGVQGDYPFRRYGSEPFSQVDHRRLASEARRCQELGASVLVTLPPDRALLEPYVGWSTIAERKRGGELAELCIAGSPQRPFVGRATGEWQPVAKLLDSLAEEQEAASGVPRTA